MTYCSHDCPTPCMLHYSFNPPLEDGQSYRDMAYEAGCKLEPPKPDDAQKQPYYSPIVRRHIDL